MAKTLWDGSGWAPECSKPSQNAELQWPAKLSAELPWHSKMTSFGEKFHMPKSPVLDTPLFLDIPSWCSKMSSGGHLTWPGHQRSPPYMASLLLFSHPLPATVLGNLQAHGHNFWGHRGPVHFVSFFFFIFWRSPTSPNYSDSSAWSGSQHVSTAVRTLIDEGWVSR